MKIMLSATFTAMNIPAAISTCYGNAINCISAILSASAPRALSSWAATARTAWIGSAAIRLWKKIREAYRSKGDTVIGDGVWIGMRSMILPGIHIGEGAVIAAGSVVAKDVPPYTVVGGNPAQPIRKRFDDSVIEELLNMHIYNYSEEQISRLVPYLCGNDMAALRKAIKNV